MEPCLLGGLRNANRRPRTQVDKVGRMSFTGLRGAEMLGSRALATMLARSWGSGAVSRCRPSKGTVNLFDRFDCVSGIDASGQGGLAVYIVTATLQIPHPGVQPQAGVARHRF
jgi:hypothetical protein